MTLQKSKKILVVDDSRLSLRIMTDILQANGYVVETATTGEDAIEKACLGQPPNLVLMDIELAGKLDGIETADRIIKALNIPVVFITANSSKKVFEKIKNVNAYGFILKGADEYAVLSTVEMSLKLYEANIESNFYKEVIENSLNEIYVIHPENLKLIKVNKGAMQKLGYTKQELEGMKFTDIETDFSLASFKDIAGNINMNRSNKVKYNTFHKKKDGSMYPVEVNLQQFKSNDGDVYVAIVFDLTEIRQKEEELRRMTITDALTGVYNRRYFIQKVDEEIERARRTGAKFSIIMFDIDHFKKVNDTYGHNSGDLVLKMVSQTIRDRIRRIDCLARWGGEEFIILLPNTSIEGAAILAEDLRKTLSELDIPVVGHVTASFGVASYKENDTVDSIVQKADDMLYEAKRSGRNCVKCNNN